jgi:hypothetical protein
MNSEKKTYTLFHTDLKLGADKENPQLSDVKNLSTGQILNAWSILYIRASGEKFYLKNSEPSKPLKRKNRFQLLKEQL